ncbi:MAG: PD-(D/E)XK nuclease family protein [Rhodospirillaceae bacterium]
MSPLPPRQQQTRDAIYAAYAARQDGGHRPHLGASLIGRECERDLWYRFRWALTVMFEGRMLRLFETGDHEEPRLVNDLRAIGCTVMEVDPETGRQWRVRDDTGHFGGSADGVGLGIPEAPKTWHLLEFKTHNDKSFKALTDKGVKASKPEHFAQMQVYMHLLGLERALYMAKNKNTDELHCERVHYDSAAALRLVEKARRIITAARPPERPFKPDFYLCKWCDHRGICHDGELPERNCRTCMHATPVDGGQWHCAKHDEIIPIDAQRQAHPCHRHIPDNVRREQIDVRGDDIVYQGWTDEGR